MKTEFWSNQLIMNNKYVYLSHFISNATPLYGGALEISIISTKQIKKGDSCNTLQLSFPNHVSTHVDFPKHFSDGGKSINDYKPEFWIFQAVTVVDYHAAPGEIISITPLLEKIPRHTDLLLLRTGFQRVRHTQQYTQENPGLAPESAEALKQRCPTLKAVGMDFISASSFTNRTAGREAHKQFLLEHDILLIEDMNLENITGEIKKVMGFPLLVQDADGVPVTIVAEVVN